ncbi:GNAT family N-acetyltransferase [Nesterenkonia marinintestina]|uniref:GNAT family N-acetyltransferase n=1 Tax=Nesterenkonia marinintestina TaxID=2979865 RepID=UPI0021BFF36B|nr:GNAT family protein [Nesterenkonia sp. GX14115]
MRFLPHRHRRRRRGSGRGSAQPHWPVTLTAEAGDGAVLLRPISLADEHRYLALQLRNHDWLAPWSATTPEHPGTGVTSAGFRAGTRALLKQARRGASMPWLIWFAPRDAGRTGAPPEFGLVGQLTVGPIIGGSARSTSIGYWMDEAHAGRGIMTAAVAAAVDHLLDVRGLHRVEIAVRPENLRSLRVVEKLGLREEGLRLRFLHIGGAWADHRIFAITAEEPRAWASPRG